MDEPMRNLKLFSTSLIVLIICAALPSGPAVAGQHDIDKYTEYLNKGFEFERTGDVKNALDQYTSAILVHPGEAEAYARASILHLILKDSDKALKAARQALRINPTHRGALLNKSVVELSMGQHEEALKTTQKALKHFPDDINIMNNMATAQMQLGKLNKAEKTLLKILDLEPGSASASYNLACTYSLSGLKALSFFYLEKAFSINPALKQQAKTDPDLEYIRKQDLFKELLSK